jgi:CubicO group peptidase (beta-lactamase class C family)
VGAAVADGSLGLNDQVVQYVPELKGTAYDGVTVQHLLAMTSGVKWDEDYSAEDSDVVRLALGLGGDAGHDQLKELAALPREAEPGERFAYKTGETNLLGIILMRATGTNLADYLAAKIWQPCGMESSAWWALDRQGRELAGCCLSMTLRDYARFGLFSLDGGNGILPSDWMLRATSDATGNHYGYQWWVLDDDVFAANGIFGQLIAVDRRSKSVAVILSAWEAPLSEQGERDRFQYLYKIRSIVMGGTGE